MSKYAVIFRRAESTYHLMPEHHDLLEELVDNYVERILQSTIFSNKSGED